jgi:hypothetical protein
MGNRSQSMRGALAGIALLLAALGIALGFDLNRKNLKTINQFKTIPV